MAHPLIPSILELATPVADDLGLEVVGAVFQTNQSPPVLRIDVRNRQTDDTSLEDCEKMSQSFEAVLESTDLLPDAYVLEISSPGISSELSSDRDFVVFKGFMVEVHLSEPYRQKRTWIGQLVNRDEESIRLSQKGKTTALPRSLVTQVQLSNETPD